MHKERDRGTKVQTRFTQLKNMDSSTSFFFALERKVREKKLITHLKLSDGRETTETREIMKNFIVLKLVILRQWIFFSVEFQN